MRLLALAHWPELEALSRSVLDVPHEVLRAPETGLVMLRGRMGSSGAPFNFGEATVTRCAVKLAGGEEGHGYVMGRNAAHARAAALCDALLQDEAQAGNIAQSVLQPLEALLAERRATLRSKAAATKVDFFTMVRGDV